MHEFFRRFSNATAGVIGTPWMFLFVIAAIAASGYYFHFSEEWRLNVSHIVAVISLLVLIILQSSQNHNDKATHLKLDELIQAHEGARDEVAAIEEETAKNMDKLKQNPPSGSGGIR